MTERLVSLGDMDAGLDAFLLSTLNQAN